MSSCCSPLTSIASIETTIEKTQAARERERQVGSKAEAVGRTFAGPSVEHEVEGDVELVPARGVHEELLPLLDAHVINQLAHHQNRHQERAAQSY